MRIQERWRQGRRQQPNEYLGFLLLQRLQRRELQHLPLGMKGWKTNH
jgi:hypothetical protein